MPHKRAVWILDGTLYLDYLIDCFLHLSNHYPWLHDIPKPTYTWNWQAILQQPKELFPYNRRDALISWIVREELEKCYYLGINNHIHIPEFAEIRYVLRNQFNLEYHTFHYLPIPRYSGYVTSRFIERMGAAIVLELEFD